MEYTLSHKRLYCHLVAKPFLFIDRTLDCDLDLMPPWSLIAINVAELPTILDKRYLHACKVKTLPVDLLSARYRRTSYIVHISVLCWCFTSRLSFMCYTCTAVYYGIIQENHLCGSIQPLYICIKF